MILPIYSTEHDDKLSTHLFFFPTFHHLPRLGPSSRHPQYLASAPGRAHGASRKPPNRCRKGSMFSTSSFRFVLEIFSGNLYDLMTFHLFGDCYDVVPRTFNTSPVITLVKSLGHDHTATIHPLLPTVPKRLLSHVFPINISP